MDKSLKKAIFGLSAYEQVKWVKLFGSRARGDNEKRSDYDIAIDFDHTGEKNWLDIEEDLQEATLLPMDIIDYRTVKGDVKKHIDVQGKIIFLNEVWYVSLVKLGDAIAALEQVIDEPMDDKFMARDSVITRFEFVIELFGKTFKHLEEYMGDSAEKIKFARDAVKRAYQVGWINEADVWIEMLDSRNKTSHRYDEDVADEVYQKVKANFPEMKRTYLLLKEKFIDKLDV